VDASGTTDVAVPLRGQLIETQKTNLMEKVQDAQFRACAAAAGCTLAKPEPDDGMDWVVFHRSSAHAPFPQVQIEVQLRSTSRVAPPLGDEFSFPVDTDTFSRLTEPSYYPRLLIICVLPVDIDEWIYADLDHDIFQLRHLSYWKSLKGEISIGRTQTTVHISTEKVFDDLSLCAIMKRVGAGEEV